ARRVSSEVLDPVRLRRVRARRGAPRGATRPRRQVAGLRSEPRHDLRVLRPAVSRPGHGGAGDRTRDRGALAAERRVRGRRDLPVQPGRPGADGHAARAAECRRGGDPRPGRGPARARGVVMSRPGRLVLPIVSRHLAREFLRAFALSFTAFIAIYVIAEFFDRFDSFLKHDAPAGAILRYFVFKLPLVVTQVTPVAVLAGGLVGLGLLARQNEFVALRACGVSIWQIATPLLVLAALISAGIFVWNEAVVPYSAHQWHTIDNVEIRKRGVATVFTG